MAAPDLRLCSTQDCLDVFNNNLVLLRELAGGSGTTFDVTLFDKPILVASSEIDASAGNKFGLQYSGDPSIFNYNIRNKTALRAAYWFWIYCAQGKALPPELAAAIETANKDLERVEDGKKGLGQTKTPGSRVTSAGPLDIRLPPGGGYVNRMTVAGFRRW